MCHQEEIYSLILVWFYTGAFPVPERRAVFLNRLAGFNVLEALLFNALI